eukprot:5729644-Pleurochrysis_carterae.AAC.1
MPLLVCVYAERLWVDASRVCASNARRAYCLWVASMRENRPALFPTSSNAFSSQHADADGWLAK